MQEELFTLSSNEFGNRCKETFSKLWRDKDFADVTLATDDGRQIAVHRIVLASSSFLFKRLLSNSPHSQHIVVLQGISMKRLELVLEYVYQGQCDVVQEDLDAFLSTGRELGIHDLTQEFVTKSDPPDVTGFKEEASSIAERSYPCQSEPSNDMEEASSAAKTTVPYEASGSNFLPFPTNEKQDCLQCTKCDYSTRFTQNLNKHFYARHTNHTFECKLCDSKYKWKQQLKEHIEYAHESRKGSYCLQCDFKAANPSSLKRHTQSVQEGKRFYCIQCDFSAAHYQNLKNHTQIVHEGIRYECNECDFKSTLKKGLKRHTENIHKEIVYNCTECDNKFSEKSSFKKHMKTLHLNPILQTK